MVKSYEVTLQLDDDADVEAVPRSMKGKEAVRYAMLYLCYQRLQTDSTSIAIMDVAVETVKRNFII